MNVSALGQKVYSFLLDGYKWYLRTPERSLDEAYKAALKVKEIEDEHFSGGEISIGAGIHSSTVMQYFDKQLDALLRTVRMRLTEFKASQWADSESKQKVAKKLEIEYPSLAVVLEKLQFIDQVTSKYNKSIEHTATSDLVNPKLSNKMDTTISQTISSIPLNKNSSQPKNLKIDSTEVLPRSIWSTINRLQVELNPNSEKEVINSFRQSRKITSTSVRFILILIIVPLLTHQISKAFIVSPLLERFRNPETTEIFINDEMREEALAELQLFAEEIKFNAMITNSPQLSSEKVVEKMKEKAEELAEEFRHESSSAIKNVFADIFSVGSFILILSFSKSSISALKTFLDNLVYGLSDSAKAFVIILFTDMFVGFHSPHGWEVVLEGIAHHWGLAGNHAFIFLFIATFPVILDTIFKYWIFRYLNRISPSAVATYHNMNE